VSELGDCPGLKRSEWNLVLCPLAFLSEARPYEFSREVRIRRLEVAAWREACPGQSFEELFEFSEMVRSPAHPEIYPLFPEWPEFPFLDIPSAEIKRRLVAIFPDEADLVLGEIEPDAALESYSEEAFQKFVAQLRSRAQDSSDFEEHVLLRIPWWKTDTEILRLMKLWLKARSPIGRRIYTVGSARALRQRWQTDLKALGVLRVLRAKDGLWEGDPQIYAEQSEWLAARKRAQEIIDALEHVSLVNLRYRRSTDTRT
jgi:hypothetical protein